MSTTDEMPALDPALEALLAAERAIPPAPTGLDARLLARIGGVVGWGGGGGAGGAGLGLKAMLAIAAVVVIAGGGALALRAGGWTSSEAPAQPGVDVRAPADPTGRATRAPLDEADLPAWFGDPARAQQSIAGRVVQDGAPVAGARVVLTSNASRGGLLDPLEQVSGANGRFDFGRHRAAVYDVTASAPGTGEGYVRVNTLVAEVPASTELTVELPGCAHVLHGVVRDASGGVVVGAEVIRARGKWRDVTPLGLGAVTDEHGGYQLCVPPGEVTAIVRADGYGSLTILDTVLGRRRFDVDLIPASTIVGRVVRAEDGAPVARAVVWTWPFALRPRLRPTAEVVVSGADGSFRITGVAAGRHQLWAQGDDAQSTTVSVLVDPGRESSEVVIALDAHATLVRGVVRAAGRPVPGATVSAIVDGKRASGWPPTDPDGRFSIRLARPARIALEVEGHRLLSPAELDVPGSLDGVELRVAALGELRGRVVRAGRPAAGAEVFAFSPALPQRAATTADATGAFVLRGLPAGAYTLDAQSYHARAFSTGAVPARVDLPDGGRVDGVVIELDGGASIAGVVRDQDDRPVPGADVRFVDDASGDLCRAVSGPVGEFDCAMLAGGRGYAPAVRLDPQSSIRFPAAAPAGLAPVHVADGATRVDGVILRVRVERGRIHGRVTTADGAPYPDVTVRAIEETTGYTPGTAPWVGVRSAISDGDGRFALEVVGGARYTLHARAPGGAESSVTGVAAGGAEVALRLDEPGRIRGTLAGFAGRPTLIVRALGNTVDGAHARIDGDTFVVDGLAPGTYAVMAMAGVHGAAETVVVRAGVDAVVALRARPTATVAGRVVDFVTGRPVAGVRCSAAPFVADAGVFDWGTASAAPTDADGRFTLEAPSGSIELSCPDSPSRGGGAARLAPAAGARAEVEIPVVATGVAHNGVGVRWLLGFGPAGRYTHTIVELRPDGVGARAGLRVGDTLVAVDGREVAFLVDVARLLGGHAVGSTVELTHHRRGSAPRRVSVVVEGPWWP